MQEGETSYTRWQGTAARAKLGKLSHQHGCELGCTPWSLVIAAYRTNAITATTHSKILGQIRRRLRRLRDPLRIFLRQHPNSRSEAEQEHSQRPPDFCAAWHADWRGKTAGELQALWRHDSKHIERRAWVSPLHCHRAWHVSSGLYINLLVCFLLLLIKYRGPGGGGEFCFGIG